MTYKSLIDLTTFIHLTKQGHTSTLTDCGYIILKMQIKSDLPNISNKNIIIKHQKCMQIFNIYSNVMFGK